MTNQNAAPPILPDHVEETISSIKRLHAEHHGERLLSNAP